MDQIEHLYHQECHCVCREEQVLSGAFHATARCRSLVNAGVATLIHDLQPYESAIEALERAREIALMWTLLAQDDRPNSSEPETTAKRASFSL
jgi:hypothetical protein